jgi:hypothetical protein
MVVAISDLKKESLIQATELKGLLTPASPNHYSGGAGGGG